MSGRRCGDLGERCKRSQRLQLDLACGPRWRAARPYPPLGQTPVSRHRKGPPVEKYVGPDFNRVRACASTIRRHDGMTSQICDAVVRTEITLPVSSLRKGGGPPRVAQTSQLLLPVARCNGLQRFKRSIPFSGCSPVPRRPRCSGHKRDLRDPSPALLDGCHGLRMRSLNDTRQGSLATVLLHLESGANGFRQSGREAQRPSPGLVCNRANR
jgi:hypothetical protein